MPNGRHVYSNLMGAASLNAYPHQRELAKAVLEPARHIVVRNRRPSIILRLCGHARPPHGIASHPGIDRTLLPLHLSLNQRNVGLFHLAAGKHLSQRRMGAVVFGHHDQAARIFIEPVNNSGAQVAARGRKRLEPVQQRIHQRAPAARVLVLPRPGVNHHARRFVHHSQVRVLIDHVQGNVFCRRLQRRGMGLAGNGDALAAAQLQRSLFPFAVDQHIALVHEHLHARAAHALKLRSEKLVEPLPCCLSGYFDGAQFSHLQPRFLLATLQPWVPHPFAVFLAKGWETSTLDPSFSSPAIPALRPAPTTRPQPAAHPARRPAMCPCPQDRAKAP